MRAYTKEEEKTAKQLAKMMVDSSLKIGDDIFAHLGEAPSLSGHELSHLNVEREKEIEGFKGYWVFYVPKMDLEKFTPGYFGVKYVDNSGYIHFLVELNRYSEKIPETIIRSSTEWLNFPSEGTKAMEEIFRDFRHEYAAAFLTEKLPNAHEVAIERARMLTEIKRTTHRVFSETGVRLGPLGTLVPRQEMGAVREVIERAY